jgi:hypothetical protein
VDSHQSAMSKGAMPIRPFLASQAFEPELIRQMSLALENVCAKLALTLTDDPATRRVASKIIELAQRGVRDAPTLTAMTLNGFEHSVLRAIVGAIPRHEAALLTIGAIWDLDEDYETTPGVMPDLIQRNLQQMVSKMAGTRDMSRFDPTLF